MFNFKYFLIFYCQGLSVRLELRPFIKKCIYLYVYRYPSQNRRQLEMEVQERTIPLSSLGCFTEAARRI